MCVYDSLLASKVNDKQKHGKLVECAVNITPRNLYYILCM